MTGSGLEEVSLRCPYCGERIRTLVDFSADEQEYYEDCAVYCAPIRFYISAADREDSHQLIIRREDDV